MAHVRERHGPAWHRSVLELTCSWAQLELEADADDEPAARDVESGHAAVPAGPRWGASYAMQLRILFTRCGARLADACTLPRALVLAGRGARRLPVCVLQVRICQSAVPKQGLVCGRRAPAARSPRPPCRSSAPSGAFLTPVSARAGRALVVRRFQSLSVQDICQFIIVGLLTGCARPRPPLPTPRAASAPRSARADGTAAAAGASGSSAPARARSPPRRTRSVRAAPHAGLQRGCAVPASWRPTNTAANGHATACPGAATADMPGVAPLSRAAARRPALLRAHVCDLPHALRRAIHLAGGDADHQEGTGPPPRPQ